MVDTRLPLTDELQHWLNELYQQANSQPLTQFKEWCFSSIEHLLPFDSGIWATRSDLQAMHREHWVDDTTVYNQPDAFMANYLAIDQTSQSQDHLNQHLANNPNQFFTIWDCCDRELWYQEAFYREHCIKFGVENAISAMVHPTDNSAVFHVLSFYRADKAAEFTPQEVLLADFVLPNLVEAFRINVLNTFSQSHGKGGTCRGVLDRYGAMLEAEQGFVDKLRKKRLIDTANKVKIPDLEKITESGQRTIKGLTLDITFIDGVFLLEVNDDVGMGTLTRREKQILAQVSEGNSSKVIAKNLSARKSQSPISPHTVNNHLSNIFAKLNVSNRTQAAALYLEHTAKSEAKT